MTQPPAHDGIHAPVPRARMSESVRRMWDAHAIVPGALFYQAEFGFYGLDAWREQGMPDTVGQALPQSVMQAKLFGLDAPAVHSLGQLRYPTTTTSTSVSVRWIWVGSQKRCSETS